MKERGEGHMKGKKYYNYNIISKYNEKLMTQNSLAEA